MNQDTIILRVVDICDPHCVSVEDGGALFQRILSVLQSDGKVCLNFVEVITLTSSFLNASIGKLFGQFKDKYLEKQITWKNLDENDAQLIELVIRNAKEHFAKPENTRQAEDNIIQRSIEGD